MIKNFQILKKCKVWQMKKLALYIQIAKYVHKYIEEKQQRNCQNLAKKISFLQFLWNFFLKGFLLQLRITLKFLQLQFQVLKNYFKQKDGVQDGQFSLIKIRNYKKQNKVVILFVNFFYILALL
ncbi:hypothetical protein IMG5_095230 [Ichthyophthirius multifiliis]|uniref:Uncharacterized protein n=1 Tax=Ichthyophthirius multifiliis TaxID=5932 RepID=G0QRM8_ICHMU|nr:hypothetical protein IMG5_095230 [Ichthyophthirius multifiliis]EGR32127.1 hypothetical protein IMG5_095230 [Ichthyophthirius multifiliis]|eukprot:XP_004035613.1 hypothetical protein IMG5_095230 [Ichthyophthirius multifiliis]